MIIALKMLISTRLVWSQDSAQYFDHFETQ